MPLADFGVAFVIIIAIALVAAIIVRDQGRKRHPPLTEAEKTARLEKELADVNKTIEEIDKWDT